MCSHLQGGARGIVDITYEFEFFAFGDNDVRRRLTRVTGSGLRVGGATPRQTGANAPRPLSQYDLGQETPGYRLEHTERGHIIGLQFGGPESIYNLVPMYAGFNGGSGGWGQMEAALASLLGQHSHRRVRMDVQIRYPAIDTAIPNFFLIQFAQEGTAPVPLDAFPAVQLHVHPPAQLSYDELDEPDLQMLDVLKRAQRLMMQERWLVEHSGQVEIPGSGRSMRSGTREIPVSIGAVDPSKFDLTNDNALQVFYLCRPYAVLDYLWFQHRSVYNGLGFGAPGVFTNTQPFSEAQRSAIRKVNILAHLGYMKSDIHGLVADLESYEDLYVGSADASAQVDHISGKAESGSNCFSNARLTSKMANIALNNAAKKLQLNSVYEDQRNWPALMQRFQAFWTGL